VEITTPYVRGRHALVSAQLPPDQLERLDALARAARTSRSALIRQAVDHYLALVALVPDEIVIQPAERDR